MRLINMDVALVKNIVFGETKRLQFRAEAFNVFNHMVLAVPGDVDCAILFGRDGQLRHGRSGQRHRQHAAGAATSAEVFVLSG